MQESALRDAFEPKEKLVEHLARKIAHAEQQAAGYRADLGAPLKDASSASEQARLQTEQEGLGQEMLLAQSRCRKCADLVHRSQTRLCSLQQRRTDLLVRCLLGMQL